MSWNKCEVSKTSYLLPKRVCEVSLKDLGFNSQEGNDEGIEGPTKFFIAIKKMAK